MQTENQNRSQEPPANKRASGGRMRRLVRGVFDLPAPKFMVRMIYRGMANDCDNLARRLSSFGHTAEARQAREWAVTYRTTADEI